MVASSFQKVLFVFLLGILLTSCERSTPTPEVIDWSRGAEAESLSTGNTVGSILGSNNTAGTTVPQFSGYDPSLPPPKFTLPSLWREFVDAPFKNDVSNRSRDAYWTVIKQFDVENKKQARYFTPAYCGSKYSSYAQACGSEGVCCTRCNIFVSDVMNAMGAHLPTKAEVGLNPVDSMPANAEYTHSWLEQGKGGWRKLNPNNLNDWNLLLEHVASGKPAIASHPDHIAVILPDQSAGLSVGNTGGLSIAQAGAYNSNQTTVGKAFGNRTIDIYIHD